MLRAGSRPCQAREGADLPTGSEGRGRASIGTAAWIVGGPSRPTLWRTESGQWVESSRPWGEFRFVLLRVGNLPLSRLGPRVGLAASCLWRFAGDRITSCVIELAAGGQEGRSASRRGRLVWRKSLVYWSLSETHTPARRPSSTSPSFTRSSRPERCREPSFCSASRTSLVFMSIHPNYQRFDGPGF